MSFHCLNPFPSRHASLYVLHTPYLTLGWVALQERFWGRQADANLCVTKAMQQDLQVCPNLPGLPFMIRP